MALVRDLVGFGRTLNKKGGEQFHIEGMEQLYASLQTLSVNLQTKAARPALTKGGRLIVRRAKANVPRKSGLLYKSLGIKSRKKQGRIIVYIGANTVDHAVDGVKKKTGGFHAYIIDRGTVQRKTKRGANRGAGPATRYYQNAIEQSKPEVARILQTELAAGIAKYARPTA